MATLGHRAFRELISGYGGYGLLYGEMASAAALASGGRFERYYVDGEPDPGRFVIQLVGGSPEELERGALALARLFDAGSVKARGVDVNFGCSAPEILRQGGGAAWLAKPEKALEAFARVREALQGVRLSAKLRFPASGDEAGLLSLCNGLVSAGAEGITLHPRLPSESYGRPPRWGLVALLAKSLSVPVTGNGDVRTEADAERRFRETGCARLMIGREAVRRPWVFRLIEERRRNPSFRMSVDLLETAERFTELLEAHQPREFWKSRARRFFFYFCDNLRFAHHPRAATQTADTPANALGILRAYLEANPEERYREEIPVSPPPI
jgi:tRNA-dihydrouridine synthase B